MSIIEFIPGPPGEYGKRLEEYLYLAMAEKMRVERKPAK